MTRPVVLSLNVFFLTTSSFCLCCCSLISLWCFKHLYRCYWSHLKIWVRIFPNFQKSWDISTRVRGESGAVTGLVQRSLGFYFSSLLHRQGLSVCLSSPNITTCPWRCLSQVEHMPATPSLLPQFVLFTFTSRFSEDGRTACKCWPSLWHGSRWGS